ncbi:unnamed protein product [Adineta steineri]|uniref:WD repeat-containing protein 44 n=1 Tax=Adineta steineri TaxID=433720 RepID=A0A815S436_9BILA|nr:unnamed protein product [Adineta steineri]CAF1639164.1 unnamed protein product [Adineta steineri]
MTSSSNNDDTTLSDTDDESVFYDANSSPTNNDIKISLQQEPRWRIPSKQESFKTSENFSTIPLTEDQLHDIQRRDKLQRLRDHDNSNSPTITIKSSTESPQLARSTIVEQKLNDNNTSPTSDEHIDNEYNRRHKQSSASTTSKQTFSYVSPASSEQWSPAYSTLSIASASNTSGYYSNRNILSASSEPSIVDLHTIDRITKYGELSPNSRKLNDDEILQQPIVRNLDNGKYMPLIDANPMTQTILERVRRSESMIPSRRGSLINSSLSLRQKSIDNLRKSAMNLSHKTYHNDDNESTSSESSNHTVATSPPISNQSSPTTVRRGTSIRKQLVHLVAKNILRKEKIKTIDDRHDTGDDEEDETGRVLINDGSNGDLKYKASRYLKEPAQFDKTQLLQTIVNAHSGPIWCMRFSPDGRLLATGGQDSLLKVWIFKSAQPYFNDFSQLSSNSSQQQNEILVNKFNEFHRTVSSESAIPTINAKLGLNEIQAPLYTKPFCELAGHQAPVLDVAWSKSLFLLSSSMDKTVRLWHLSRLECLCYFRHVDFVSAIAFHPRDDRFFVSASLDGHVRLWNIPDKRVVHWTLIPAQASSQITAAQANLITAVNFCDDGRKVTVGTFDGRFLLYTDSLRYDTVMNIGDKDGSRSHRSRKKRRKPYKITGIESMNSNNSKVLITSNDSRIRLYNIRTKEIERKYRGYSNQSSQIRASISPDDQYIISGSEDSWFYVWRTEPSINGNVTSTNAKLTKKQRRYFDRAYERIRVHNTMVTSAIFAPNPVVIMNQLYSTNDFSPMTTRSTLPSQTPVLNNSNRTRFSCLYNSTNSSDGSISSNINGPIYVMVTADSKGQLKLLINRYHR